MKWAYMFGALVMLVTAFIHKWWWVLPLSPMAEQVLTVFYFVALPLGLLASVALLWLYRKKELQMMYGWRYWMPHAVGLASYVGLVLYGAWTDLGAPGLGERLGWSMIAAIVPTLLVASAAILFLVAWSDHRNGWRADYSRSGPEDEEPRRLRPF